MIEYLIPDQLVLVKRLLGNKYEEFIKENIAEIALKGFKPIYHSRREHCFKFEFNEKSIIALFEIENCLRDFVRCEHVKIYIHKPYEGSYVSPRAYSLDTDVEKIRTEITEQLYKLLTT